MILIIDNYDSFTYNLYQYIGKFYQDILVKRNDEITLEEIEMLAPQAIVISPGPGYPASAGISVAAIQKFSGSIPILGVCLGHQSIGEAFGGKTVHAKTLMHGKASEITIQNKNPLFSGLPERVTVGRYHSLISDRDTLPACLEILAEDEDGEIMAFAHKEHPTYGVQFHPESILTECGLKILENFCDRIAHLPITGRTESAVPPAQRNLLKPYIFKIIEGEDLTEAEAIEAMDCIMSGGATNAQIGSFVTALRMKGETIPEITGFARVMRQKAQPMPGCSDSIDIVGTGGDMVGTFNISTTSAFVAAGAGARVAKHGNRSVSSRSGAADVLEALGMKIAMTPDQAAQSLNTCGLSFLFAQSFHGSMRFAAAPRKEIGVRSVFNILGPLANPAQADYILLGVYDEDLMEPMARVLMNLGIKGAMLVHGDDGLDEITISNTTRVCEIRDGKLIKYDLDPRDYGMELAELSSVVGGTAQENAQITMDILQGKPGPCRDIVLLNAGCALYTIQKAASIEEGIALAKDSIDSGKALKKLNEFKAFTHSIQ